MIALGHRALAGVDVAGLPRFDAGRFSFVQRQGGDDGCNALIDFGAGDPESEFSENLGLGNSLTVLGAGEATLAQDAGSDDHVIVDIDIDYKQDTRWGWVPIGWRLTQMLTDGSRRLISTAVVSSYVINTR